MKQRRIYAWMDALWLTFLAGLAALEPVLEIQKHLILLLIGITQIFEHLLLEKLPYRGRNYSVILKILLGTLLVYYTNGIFSNYYLIYFLPVVTAAMYFELGPTLVWTALASAAYWSFVLWELSEYELTAEGASILGIRSLFFFLAAITVNRFVTENREQAERLVNTNRLLAEAQEEARRSERLAALGQLSAGLAHELRNPLAVIKGSAETLTRKLSGSDPITTEVAGYISSEVNRMNDLVTRFLEFARPHKLECRAQQVPPLIDHALKAARERWPEAKVNVETRYAPDLPEVPADGELLEHVFTNLAFNAYEAMGRDGGMLRVTAEPGSEGSHGIEIVFQDTGPGIPDELREQIFNPFFTTKHSGVGLGLSIASKILDAHGGWIRVASEAPRGSSFQIFLPEPDQRTCRA